MAKVDILIPAYNRSRLILPCLESALCQTVRDVRVVVFDDGSTESYSLPNDSRIEFHRSAENRGTAAARNALLSLVRSPYACWLDSDDTCDSRRVELCLNEIEASGVDVVFSYMRYMRRGKKGGLAVVDPSRYSQGNKGLKKNMAFATAFFKKSVSDRFKFKANPVTGDEARPWVLSLIEGGCSFGVVKVPLYFYRMHSGRGSWRLKR